MRNIYFNGVLWVITAAATVQGLPLCRLHSPA